MTGAFVLGCEAKGKCDDHPGAAVDTGSQMHHPGRHAANEDSRMNGTLPRGDCSQGIRFFPD
ncbi:hypothetical protein C9I56_26460 [Paraburkholderia caribensis]|nr:hypothetical protein C9I56_26460 [Paraburkholderia caribensis]